VARRFTQASSELIDFNDSLMQSLNWQWGTIMCAARRASDGGTRGLIGNENSGHTDNGFVLFLDTNDPILVCSGGASPIADAGVSVVTADGWFLLGGTKDTGNVTPRHHFYKWTTNAWTHSGYTGTVTDGPSTATRPYNLCNTINGGSDGWDGDIAAVMVLPSRVMTDSEIERLAAGRWDHWLMQPNDFLIEFPSGRDNVIASTLNVRTTDRQRTVATTVTGTSRTTTNDPPGFRFSRLKRRR